jgi:hypothetical protein
VLWIDLTAMGAECMDILWVNVGSTRQIPCTVAGASRKTVTEEHGRWLKRAPRAEKGNEMRALITTQLMEHVTGITISVVAMIVVIIIIITTITVTDRLRKMAEAGTLRPGERKAPGACWTCGKQGHKALDCPSQTRCQLCEGQGHTASNCEKWKECSAKKEPTIAALPMSQYGPYIAQAPMPYHYGYPPMQQAVPQSAPYGVIQTPTPQGDGVRGPQAPGMQAKAPTLNDFMHDNNAVG